MAETCQPSRPSELRPSVQKLLRLILTRARNVKVKPMLANWKLFSALSFMHPGWMRGPAAKRIGPLRNLINVAMALVPDHSQASGVEVALPEAAELVDRFQGKSQYRFLCSIQVGRPRQARQ